MEELVATLLETLISHPHVATISTLQAALPPPLPGAAPGTLEGDAVLAAAAASQRAMKLTDWLCCAKTALQVVFRTEFLNIHLPWVHACLKACVNVPTSADDLHATWQLITAVYTLVLTRIFSSGFLREPHALL